MRHGTRASRRAARRTRFAHASHVPRVFCFVRRNSSRGRDSRPHLSAVPRRSHRRIRRPPVRHFKQRGSLSLTHASPCGNRRKTFKASRPLARIRPGRGKTSRRSGQSAASRTWCAPIRPSRQPRRSEDRKSTRLNSSHLVISYAVFCLKKKKKSKIKYTVLRVNTAIIRVNLVYTVLSLTVYMLPCYTLLRV